MSTSKLVPWDVRLENERKEKEAKRKKARKPKKEKPPKPPKPKRRRGRPRSLQTVEMLLFQRALFLAWRSKEKFRCQEEFAIALGVGDRVGFIPEFAEKEKDPLGSAVKTRRFGRVPILKTPDIVFLHQHKHLPERRGVTKVPISVYCKQELLCYAFLMPDDKMRHEGICAGDIVIAAENIRPGHNDLVVCRLPGSEEVTIRRYYATACLWIFYLNGADEDDSIVLTERDDVILGVVMGIERDYHPLRFEKFEAAK